MMDGVNALPGRCASRLDPTGLGHAREAAHAGEWGEAVDNLIASLAKTEAGVTTAAASNVCAEVRRQLSP